MTIRIVAIVVLLACIVSTSGVLAQKATEVYIPIGESPGVSRTSSYIGEISRVDYAARSIEIVNEDGTRNIRVDDETLYYLDRSREGKKNSVGAMHDCKIGRRIEVGMADDGSVSWIKIDSD